MRSMLLIAELTLREAWRRKIAWIAVILGIAFIVLYGIGFFFIFRDMGFTRGSALGSVALDSGVNMIAMSGLYAISFLGIMLTVLLSVGTLANEIQTHTIQSIATKAQGRASIVLGKWLGLAAMLSLYIVLLAAGVALTTWLISGHLLPHLGEGLLLMVLECLVMLSVCLAGGTLLATIPNGVVAFMMYGLAFVGGWIEQIGSAMHNETAVDIGILSSLIMPSEAVWKRAAYRMQPPALSSLNLSPFSMASAPSPMMLVYAALYCAFFLWLAVRWFERRDL